MSSNVSTADPEHDLARRVMELEGELGEAYRREAATAEVLKVISRSPTNVQPVFDTIAQSVARLCEAQYSYVFRFDGQLIHHAAWHGLPEKAVLAITDSPEFPRPPGRGKAVARSILNGTIVEIPDILSDPEYQQGPMSKVMGYRSVVAVPMLKDGRPIGAITMVRPQAGIFSPRQIELVKIFADQAVIAIENARLFEAEQASKREVQESLEYQTATGEILSVISRSPTDVQPVFDTIAANALRLCGATFSVVARFDGKLMELVSIHNLSEFDGVEALRRAFPRAPAPGGANDQAILTRAIAYIPDVQKDLEYQHQGLAQAASYRSILSVPMLSDGNPVGVITVAGASPGMFSERQAALLTTFADQAVIAIENTRLFEEVQARNTELKVALEQQTATSELLKVIGRSTFELQPVFETLAENAVRLCEAERAFVHRFDGKLLRVVATHNVSPELRAYVDRNPITPGRHSVVARAALERRSTHINDVRADLEITYMGNEIEPVRTALSVPMLRADELLGVIMIYRHEVRPFADSQIALMETFADQAVIAIENTRLFEEVEGRTRELQESLEYQTATSDVLNVISRSPSQLQPVVNAIVETAKRLCSAERANMWRLRAGKFDLLGHTHATAEQELATFLQENPILADRSSIAGRAVLERRTIHVPDVSSDPELSGQKQIQHSKNRTMLVVPLLREGEPIGALALAKTEVQPFTDKQIELVTTFADQAVIAIENTRLFEEVQARTTELQETLDFQTATSDVLGVISRSPNQLQPVLDAIVRTAFGLCPSDRASIMLRTGNRHRFVAGAGFTPDEMKYRLQQSPITIDRGSVSGRVALEGRTIHVLDVKSDPDYTH